MSVGRCQMQDVSFGEGRVQPRCASYINCALWNSVIVILCLWRQCIFSPLLHFICNVKKLFKGYLVMHNYQSHPEFKMFPLYIASFGLNITVNVLNITTAQKMKLIILSPVGFGIFAPSISRATMLISIIQMGLKREYIIIIFIQVGLKKEYVILLWSLIIGICVLVEN